MEFPVRCFTCGTVIGHLYEKYKELVKVKSAEESMDELNVPRHCCRRMFLSHVDMMGQITRYPRI